MDKKIPDATTAIHINQYNTLKQSLDKKNGDVDEKVSEVSGLVATTAVAAAKNTISTVNDIYEK